MSPPDSDSAELASLVQRLDRQRRARSAAEAISEQATRDLYREQKDLILLQAVGVATNEASTFEEAIQGALDQICTHTGWPVGHALFQGSQDDELVSTALWFIAGQHLYAPFRAASEHQRTRIAPRTVASLAEGQALLRTELTPDSGEPLLDVAWDCGLRSQFLFPVYSGSRLAAILEFYTPELTPPPQPLVEVMTQVGRVLGRVLERSEQRLSTSGAEEYRVMFDADPTPMWVYDADSLAFLSVNDAAIQHYGYGREEFLAKTLRDVYLLEDGRVDFNDHGLWKHRLRDGTIIDVQVSAHELTMPGRRARLVQAVDVTERNRNEEAVRLSERRFRDLLQNVQLLSVLVDLVGTVTFCNRHILELSGFERSELLGQDWFDTLVAPDEREAARASFLEGVRRGEIAQHHEGHIVSRSGQRLLISWDSTLLRDANESVIGMASIGSDITNRRRTEEALRESEERYALAVNGANDGLWDWDLRACKVFFSPRWKTMLGLPADEEITSPEQWFNRVHPDEVSQLMERIDAHLNGLTPHFEHEHRVRHANGSFRWMLTRGLAVRGEDGAPYRMAGSQSDITERKRVQEQLQHDAFHDTLTGLPNRALFLDRLTQVLKRRRSGSLCAVLFLDLDRFKVINDSLGHSSGDALLVDFAARLLRTLRAGDTVARFGGDEFTILLDDIKDVADATRAADRIREELSVPFDIAGSEIFTTASIGIALSSEHPRPDDLLRDADTAMYRAKALGPGRYEVFDTGMRTRAIALLQTETDLRRALEREEFVIHYQPIVMLETGRVCGFEALVRWQHPQRGLTFPADFISVAEDTGLIVPIGEWILREACRQTAEWTRSTPDTSLFISVNLSSRQFSDPDLDRRIERTLSETSLPPERLKLEITESVLMENAESAAVSMQRLKDLGVKVAVDDFGTGYSSLSYVHSFPIDTLKIDTSFVARLTSGRKNVAIIRTIVELARNLEMDVVAEGVETIDQVRILSALRCDLGQGYHFCRPVAELEARRFVGSVIGVN